MSENFFIHGNGFSAKCSPFGAKASVDLPGHGEAEHHASKYSIEFMTHFLTEFIPRNAIVWAHSLGGHLGINLALLREDISLRVMGTMPLASPADIGKTLCFVPEFEPFSSPERSDEDIRKWAQFNACSDSQIEEELFQEMKKQDPLFNRTFFSKGIENYEWDEVNKCLALGDRVRILFGTNDPMVNPYHLPSEIQSKLIPYESGEHCPWLENPSFFKEISRQIDEESSRSLGPAFL